MRCVVYTETNFLELGISAKDAFLKCLPPDKSGQFDTINTMSDEIMANINKLTDDDLGMAWQKEYSYADKMKKVMRQVVNGRKFMITNQWSGQEHMIDATRMLNDGKSISEVNQWIKNECERLNKLNELKK